MQYSSKDLARHSHSDDLSMQCGIVAGTVEQFAAALDTTPDGLFRAVRGAGIDLMVDTGTPTSSREDHARPTSPPLRSLAMTRADFGRLSAWASVCDSRDHVRDMSMSEESHLTTSPSAMPDQPKTRDIRVRIEPDLHDKVQQAADREGRSLSGYVRHTLQRQLDIEQRLYAGHDHA
jgi:hypothetical protein